jgi:DNA-directed RNA polymerase subunit beta
VTTLLYALGMDGEEDPRHLLQEEVPYKHEEADKGWVTRSTPSAARRQADLDLVDAKTGEVVLEGRQEDHAAPGQEAGRRRPQGLLVPFEDLSAAISPRTSSTRKTGEIYVEAGDELTEKLDRDGAEGRQGFDRSSPIPVLDIDHVNVGPYIRNTLAVDKNMNRETR